MRVAIVHYWLVGMRGGEKVLECLCDLYPDAVIFTHAYNPDRISKIIKRHEIRCSFIGSLPRSTHWYKSYLPLMPLALEQLDLRGFDLIISSEAGPAKGIIPPPDSLHVCYCHSPMRYVWNMYQDHLESAGAIKRFFMPPVAHYLRSWDVTTASRVDHFIANSENVRRRIDRYYRREALVLPPPVAIGDFEIAPPNEISDAYLMVGELVPYKRPDLAIAAFNKMRKPLTVIGGGELLPKLRRLAGPTVNMLGHQPFGVLRHHYARCKALIFPGEEDAGIVPLEAMASGRPVIAFGRGGATETVRDGDTGIFFAEQSIDSITRAIERFESMQFSATIIRHAAERFGAERFKSEFFGIVRDALNTCARNQTSASARS